MRRPVLDAVLRRHAVRRHVAGHRRAGRGDRADGGAAQQRGQRRLVGAHVGQVADDARVALPVGDARRRVRERPRADRGRAVLLVDVEAAREVHEERRRGRLVVRAEHEPAAERALGAPRAEAREVEVGGRALGAEAVAVGDAQVTPARPLATAQDRVAHDQLAVEREARRADLERDAAAEVRDEGAPDRVPGHEPCHAGRRRVDHERVAHGHADPGERRRGARLDDLHGLHLAAAARAREGDEVVGRGGRRALDAQAPERHVVGVDVQDLGARRVGVADHRPRRRARLRGDDDLVGGEREGGGRGVRAGREPDLVGLGRRGEGGGEGAGGARVARAGRGSPGRDGMADHGLRRGCAGPGERKRRDERTEPCRHRRLHRPQCGETTVAHGICGHSAISQRFVRCNTRAERSTLPHGAALDEPSTAGPDRLTLPRIGSIGGCAAR